VEERGDPARDVGAVRRRRDPPPGARGEICLRARSNPHWPLGHRNNEEAGRETFGGEWFHTKDAAQEDADGYYWYAGRADDVIISAGYRIGPFEVESACIEHPAVREAAAVASPDEQKGNIVKAFVVPAEGHSPSDELARDIQGFVRAHLSAYAYPRRIEVRPLLGGRGDRAELRKHPERVHRLPALDDPAVFVHAHERLAGHVELGALRRHAHELAAGVGAAEAEADGQHVALHHRALDVERAVGQRVPDLVVEGARWPCPGAGGSRPRPCRPSVSRCACSGQT
jgi:hypothetical protein